MAARRVRALRPTPYATPAIIVETANEDGWWTTTTVELGEEWKLPPAPEDATEALAVVDSWLGGHRLARAGDWSELPPREFTADLEPSE